MEVHFRRGCGVADDQRAEIDWVLNNLAVGHERGCLPPPLVKAEVIRQIPGGRSGAQVLEVLIRSGTAGTDRRHVVKVQDSGDARAEWQAYCDHVGEQPPGYLAPITAVSAAVLTAAEPQTEREAVVYQHVSQHIGEPGRQLETLEELAARALGGSEEAARSAVTVVNRLMKKLRGSLYGAARPDPTRTGLRWLNPRLGPDLVVELDPSDEPVDRTCRVFPTELFAASCSAGLRAEDPRFQPGARIVVPVTSARLKGDVLLVSPSQDTVIEVLDGHEAVRRLAPDGTPPDGVFAVTVPLRARVVSTRVQAYWRLVAEVLGDDAQLEPAGLRLGEHLVGRPFGSLQSIVCDRADGWVSATTHGDLNPRNVLTADAQPYLIDHARADKDMPLLSDPAWLEMDLLRNVVAQQLSRRELVRLNRCLAVVCRRDQPAQDGEVPEAVPAWAGRGESAEFAVALRLLWQVRCAARAAYPLEGRRPWWREYLAQLTLAACRTLKWPPAAHDRGTVEAALIAAGVADECLAAEGEGGRGPFRHWPTAELHALADEVLPDLDPADEDGLALLLDIVAALDDRGPLRGDSPVAARLRRARERTVGALCAEAAEQRLRRLGRRPAFIPLRGSLSPRGEPDPSDVTARSDEPAEAVRLAARCGAAVLVGGAGAGKSTVLAELEYLYACAVTGERTDPGLPPRMPLLMHGADLVRAIETAGGHVADVLARAAAAGATLGRVTCGRLLALGGLQLLVDGVDELPRDARDIVTRWLAELRADRPDIPLVVCRRTPSHHAVRPPLPLGLPTVTLHAVTPEQARTYAAGRLTHERRTAWNDLLFGDGPQGEYAKEQGPGSAGLRELLHTPLFLWMAVECSVSIQPPPRTSGELFEVFTRWYLTERHHSHQRNRTRTSRSALQDQLPLLEAVAEHLVEHGPVPLRRLEPRLARLRPDWEPVLREVIATEFLDERDGLVRFRHELFQAYCAGRVLARLAATDEKELLRRVLRFEWQEPARMLVGLPGTTAQTLSCLWRTAARADARYGAWLLRESPCAMAEFADGFVAEQRHVLRTASAGPEAWRRAATALTVLRDDRAWSALTEVAEDPATTPGALAAALHAMADAARPDAPVAGRPRGEGTATAALRGAVKAVLERPVPAEVESAALRAVGQGGVRALSAYLPERIREDSPWPVVREATAALTALGMELPPALRTAQEAACRRRLAAADAEARESPRSADSTVLSRERVELLSVIGRSGGPDALEVLLEHRFDPALADLPHWSRLLTDAARARRAADAQDPLAALLLGAEAGVPPDDVRGRALRAFADGTDTEALAAAHRLLTDDEVLPRELLELVRADSSGKRLLAAAAVVEGLAPAQLPIAEGLADRMIAHPRPEDSDWLAALAALVGAVGQQSSLRRARLVHAATRALESRGARQAMRGPWAQAYYDVEIAHDELTLLLEHGDDDSTRLAMDYMSGMDFLLTAAGRPERLSLSRDAERRVLGLRPAGWDGDARTAGPERASPAQVLRHIQAVAYTGVPGGAAFVEQIARSETAARTLVTYGHSDHGVLELALSAHAVTAVGWFGRLAGEQRRPEAMSRARDWLRHLDTDGGHPSLERARLVGLGLLGDWRPILLGLVPGDPVLHEAAKHVVLHWLPAPWQQGPPDDPQSVAAWITGFLAQQEEVTHPEVEEVLSGIVTALSRRLGRYLVDPGARAGDEGRPL